jgi:CRISPR-associated protein Csm2
MATIALKHEELPSKMEFISPQEIDATAEKNAISCAKDDRLKTAQLRNFYAAVTRLRTEYDKDEDYGAVELDLIMLKPKLAYAAGRQKAVAKTFYPLMKNAIDGVSNAGNKQKAIRNFFLLVESVVAYHKYHGGE